MQCKLVDVQQSNFRECFVRCSRERVLANDAVRDIKMVQEKNYSAARAIAQTDGQIRP